MMPFHHCRDFAFPLANSDDRAACGRDAVELTRYDQAFKCWSQRNPMGIGHTQRIFQDGSILIIDEPEIGQTSILDVLGKVSELMPAANKKKYNGGIVAEGFCSAEHSVKFMRAA